MNLRARVLLHQLVISGRAPRMYPHRRDDYPLPTPPPETPQPPPPSHHRKQNSTPPVTPVGNIFRPSHTTRVFTCTCTAHTVQSNLQPFTCAPYLQEGPEEGHRGRLVSVPSSLEKRPFCGAIVQRAVTTGAREKEVSFCLGAA